MSDQDGKKTLGLSGAARSGRVNQSFSRGRTKSVVVETKRRKISAPKPGAKSAAAQAAEGGKRENNVPDSELERRLKALQAAKAREAEDAERRKAEEKAREEERNRRRAEQEAREREEREREAALRQKEEDEAKRKAEETAKRAAVQEKPAQIADKDAAPAGAGRTFTKPAKAGGQAN